VCRVVNVVPTGGERTNRWYSGFGLGFWRMFSADIVAFGRVLFPLLLLAQVPSGGVSQTLWVSKGVAWYSVVVSCLVPLTKGPRVKMQQACTNRKRTTPANSSGATWAYNLDRVVVYTSQSGFGRLID